MVLLRYSLFSQKSEIDFKNNSLFYLALRIDRIIEIPVGIERLIRIKRFAVDLKISSPLFIVFAEV